MRADRLAIGVWAILLMTSGATTALAVAKPQPIAIESEHITSALNASGIKIAHDQVEMLCAVIAAKSQPRLKVMSVESLDDASAKARLQCERNDICLPFYVVLHWKNDSDAKSAVAAWPEIIDSRTTRHKTVKPEELLVRSGANVTLIFESQNIRMTLPVLCLQNGARGQRVRVMSKDRKKVYLAKVLSAGIVTSVLVN